MTDQYKAFSKHYKHTNSRPSFALRNITSFYNETQHVTPTPHAAPRQPHLHPHSNPCDTHPPTSPLSCPHLHHSITPHTTLSRHSYPSASPSPPNNTLPLLPLPSAYPGTPRNRTPSLTAPTCTLTNTNTPPPYLTPPQTPFLHLLNLLPHHAKPLHLTPYLPLPHLHLSSLNQPYLPPHTVIHTKRCSLLPTLTHLTPTSPTTSCASQPPYKGPATWIDFCSLHFLSYATDLGISPLAVREVQC
ncbi:hypothetical protein Pcinc_006570 [Petrolisthes cinctipes]|uniref:Uncharacterized protein n=1 Tax=Petrolisthes cinctipes TaxID=88211 RepID=A0AAE1KY97_PETCI|nr:hypothetical protein Pcinc_006570 [Petrolisthes cinctipes]